MKTALVQQASGDYSQLLQAVYPWHKKYAERHGIIYQPHFGIIREDRHPNWSRFPLLIEILKLGRADIVVWLDADCVIADGDVSLVEAADEFLLLGAVAHPEIWRDETMHLNMGAMYLRNTPRTIEFLEAVNTMGKIEGSKWENQDTIYTVAKEMKFPLCRIKNRWNSDPRANNCVHPIVRGFHGTGIDNLEEMVKIANREIARF